MPVTNYISVNGRMLSEVTDGVILDYVPDALGSIHSVVDQTATAVKTMRYKPYGEVLSRSGGISDRMYQWVGTYGYRATFNYASSHYVRARHYSQTPGSWTTVDPLWPDEAGYGYVAGGQVYLIDKTGLQKTQPRKFVPNCKQGDKAAHERVNKVIPGWDAAIDRAIGKDSCCQELLRTGARGNDPFKNIALMLRELAWLHTVSWCIGCQETLYDYQDCHGRHHDLPKGGTATGPFGILEGTWKDFGGQGDWNNPLDNLRLGIHILCYEMCRRTPQCKCGRRIGAPSPKKRTLSKAKGNAQWPSNQWPYMPGGTDDQTRQDNFKDCMANHGFAGKDMAFPK